jgi:hypothetical protein
VRPNDNRHASEWPFTEPLLDGAPVVDANGINMMLAESVVQGIVRDEYWRHVEKARHDGNPPMEFNWKTFMCISGEFIDRFGYEEARRYCTSVLAGRTDPEALLPFAALVQNLQDRYGPDGHEYLGMMLAVELHLTGRAR